MTYQRLAYDDVAEARQMTVDARAVASRLPRRRTPAERSLGAALRPAPSLRYEDYPREVGKPTIAVSEATARLASALHLHLD